MRRSRDRTRRRDPAMSKGRARNDGARPSTHGQASERAADEFIVQAPPCADPPEEITTFLEAPPTCQPLDVAPQSSVTVATSFAVSRVCFRASALRGHANSRRSWPRATRARGPQVEARRPWRGVKQGRPASYGNRAPRTSSWQSLQPRSALRPAHRFLAQARASAQ